MFGSLKKVLTSAPTVNFFLERGNNNLDLLRLTLVFFVIYSHSFVITGSTEAANYEIFNKLTGLSYVSFGGIAVKTFFMISGMLVASSLNRGVISYMISRFFRVYPPFLFCVIISASLAVTVSDLRFDEYFSSNGYYEYIIKTIKLDIKYVLPGVFNGVPYNAFNGSLWSIPFELKAYLYLMVIWVILTPIKILRNKILILVCVILILEPINPFNGSVLIKHKNPDVYLLYSSFCIGLLIKLISKYVNVYLITLISLSLMILFFTVSDGGLKTVLVNYCISLILIVLSLTIINIKYLKPPMDISYGCYLWAFPAQQLIQFLHPVSFLLNIFFSVSLTVVLAYASLLFLEKPSIAVGRNLSNAIDKISS